jgi:hypothetical protein
MAAVYDTFLCVSMHKSLYIDHQLAKWVLEQNAVTVSRFLLYSDTLYLLDWMPQQKFEHRDSMSVI